MKSFRTYQLAVTFYKATAHLRLPTHLKDQLQRSASSVVLNLAEGSGKQTAAEQRRFFLIAFASVRECQANLVLANLEDSEAAKILDSQLSELSSQNSALSSQNSALSSQNSALRTQLSALRTQLSELSSQNSALRTQPSELNSLPQLLSALEIGFLGA